MKNKKTNLKKVSDDELEKIKQKIRVKLKKQRKEENFQFAGVYFLYFIQAIVIIYGIYKIFYDKPFF